MNSGGSSTSTNTSRVSDGSIHRSRSRTQRSNSTTIHEGNPRSASVGDVARNGAEGGAVGRVDDSVRVRLRGEIPLLHLHKRGTKGLRQSVQRGAVRYAHWRAERSYHRNGNRRSSHGRGCGGEGGGGDEPSIVSGCALSRGKCGCEIGANDLVLTSLACAHCVAIGSGPNMLLHRLHRLRLLHLLHGREREALRRPHEDHALALVLEIGNSRGVHLELVTVSLFLATRVHVVDVLLTVAVGLDVVRRVVETTISTWSMSLTLSLTLALSLSLSLSLTLILRLLRTRVVGTGLASSTRTAFPDGSAMSLSTAVAAATSNTALGNVVARAVDVGVHANAEQWSRKEGPRVVVGCGDGGGGGGSRHRTPSSSLGRNVRNGSRGSRSMLVYTPRRGTIAVAPTMVLLMRRMMTLEAPVLLLVVMLMLLLGR